MANHPAFHYPDIGVLGEDLVARWLQSSGWTILHHRWRCQWGELDLVAEKRAEGAEGAEEAEGAEGEKNTTPYTHIDRTTPLLAFVEVKTRKQNNWDAGGLLAVTPQKQTRLWQAAEYFLSTHPDLATYQCRFDVALVQHRKLSLAQLRQLSPTLDISPDLSFLSVQLGQVVVVAGYQLVLQEYLPAAFG
jgi:putative endonuclease